MDPILGAALVSGGASLLGNIFGGIFGSSSQESANRTNLEIARMTNQANREQLESQQAWSEQMWQKQFDAQNEYNLPKNQVKRLLEAGINPAVLGGNNSMPAGSVGMNQPSSNAMQGATVHPYDYASVFNDAAVGVDQAVNAYYQNKLLDSQVRNKDVDTSIQQVNLQFSAMEKMANLLHIKSDISNKLSSSRLSESQRDYYQSLKEQIDWNINLFKDTYDDMKRRESLQNDLMFEQTNSVKQDIIMKKIENSYKPALLSAGLRLSNAQATSLLENLRLITPQIELLYSQGKFENAKALGQFIENRMNSIDADNKAYLQGIYNKNKITKKGQMAFYELGDLLFHSLRGILK